MFSKLTLAYLALISLAFFSCKKESNLNNAQSSSVDESTTTSTLVGWYTFNGDVLDHSGHNNNIKTNKALPTKGRKGLDSTAYYFDGKNSYMTIANSASLNPKKITLIASIKPTGFYQGVCHRNTILTKSTDDNTAGKYDLAFDDQAYYNYDGCFEPVQTKYENFEGSYGDGAGNQAGIIDTSNHVVADSWYVLAFTYDGQYAKLYINGILTVSNAVTTSFTPNDLPIYIGKLPNKQFPYNFRGVIDEIRIYSSALTAAQIQMISNTLATK